MNDYQKMVTGDKLVSLSDAWPKVSELLNIGGYDAIALVESAFQNLNLTLYLYDEATGLWSRTNTEQTLGLLSDLGCSDFAATFAHQIDNGLVERLQSGDWESTSEAFHFKTSLQHEHYLNAAQGWALFRIAPADLEKVIGYARAVANNMPASAESKLDGYPDELRAAIEAFEAVHADPTPLRGHSPKAALTAWLEQHKPELSANARERIAVVANWQPTGGAPKTPEP